MSDQVYIEDLGQHVDTEVTLKGWLYNKRSKGKLHFLLVRDGTGIAQCVVFKGDVTEEVFETAGNLSQEASVIVTGKVRADERAPGGYELGLSNVQLVSAPTEEYPIQPQEHGTGFLMDHRHLWLRSKKQNAILRIRSEVIFAIHEFFHNRGFTHVDSPVFTPNACEGTTTLFEVDYFDEKAYLTQSGQLYAEASAMAFGKVYCFGPTFRAEKSKTRRHLTEFWMVEPEIAYGTLDDVMQLSEDFLCHIVGRVLERRKPELEVLERDLSKLEAIQAPFPRLHYDDAVKMLQDAGHEFEWGGDFGAPDETFISEKYDRPVLVHHYPSAIKAFYMKPDAEDAKYSLSVDVLGPEGVGEIIGGGQREDDLSVLERKIAEHGLPEEAFKWYLDLRRFGSVPHAGFGLGVERTVAWICGVEHVRECIPFPRMLYRLYP
ncbi:MAG: asparagine--tRNA ligase [Planctomycetota bacterium]